MSKKVQALGPSAHFPALTTTSLSASVDASYKPQIPPHIRRKEEVATTTAKMMRKKTTYTNVTPIPSFIPRQLAVDMLQSHGEIIELNPLVTGWEAIKAPRNAPADEFYASWYEISQKIQFIPGIGKFGSGAIKFNGCFHDMPWGLQTHTYAPAGVDLRNKWQICGNQPGEPPVSRELGIGAPPEGLYLREDIEIKCNLTMVSFVKKETQAASKVLVARLIKKAELLDAGVLQGMMENGKLKTHNPADRRSTMPSSSPGHSPQQPYQMPMSPTRSPTFPQNQMGQQQGAHVPPQQLLGQNNIVMELPGDMYHAQVSPGFLHPDDKRNSTASSSTAQHSPDPRYSTVSHNSNSNQYSPNSNPYTPNPQDARWSQVSNSTRPSSYAPSDGMRSPGLEQNAFAAELPTMEETREEHEDREKRESAVAGGQQKYVYNPADYARTQAQYAPAPPYDGHGGQGGGVHPAHR